MFLSCGIPDPVERGSVIPRKGADPDLKVSGLKMTTSRSGSLPHAKCIFFKKKVNNLTQQFWESGFGSNSESGFNFDIGTSNLRAEGA